MFVSSIEYERILILKLKLTIIVNHTIVEVGIVKFSAANTLVFVYDDIVDICSPVKHFEECCQKNHQILKKSQV